MDAPPQPSRRAYRLHEFAAHASAVTCVAIGRRSTALLVTGGDDRLVKLWAVGKPHALLSLDGHQSSVECVALDEAEESAVAGAAGGTLKLWDLAAATAVRTLPGHRSAVVAADFHPTGGALFASASLDTCVKVWDTRQRRCARTLRGHGKGVTAVAFAPDGVWLASGGADGAVLLWDLAEGRLLAEFSLHPAAITALDFHPSELLLASAAGDGSARVWDLDARALLTEAPQAASPVRCCRFAPCGQALLAASAAGVAAHAWEPTRLADAVPLPWRRPAAAMACRDGRLLAAAPHAADVAIWVLDLGRVGPAGARLPGDTLAVQSSGTAELLPGPPMFRQPPGDSHGSAGAAMTLASLQLGSPPPPPLSPPPPLPPDPPSAPASPEVAAATALLASHAAVAAALDGRLRALRALRVAWRRGDAAAAAAALSGADGCAALGDALRSNLLWAAPAPPPAAAASALASHLAELLAPEQPSWRREAALEAAEALAPAAPGTVAQLRTALASVTGAGDALGARAARLAAALAGDAR